MQNSAFSTQRVSRPAMAKYFVKLDNGNKIKAFSWADANRLAAKTGGKVVSVPLNR